MISIELGAAEGVSDALICHVLSPQGELAAGVPGELIPELTSFLADRAHTGLAGQLEVLPRPTRLPSRVLLVGVGEGDESGWRAAGAALARSSHAPAEVDLAVPADLPDAALRGLAEGLWLGAYRYRIRDEKPEEARKLRKVTVLAPDSPSRQAALETARIVAAQTNFARDLTNTPSLVKTPAWFVDQVLAQLDGMAGLTATVRDPAQLAEEGFGGILAVGGGSKRGPRLLELQWRPVEAREHVVLVGKGITFDTGGIDIKTNEGMQLMRKDMGAAAAVVAATIAAARLRLPVRITALAPLAENMVSGSAWRSGDVVRHYGGLTSEVRNTDAEGRVVLADAMAFAVAKLAPDVLIDLATLTGAARVALGQKTAALFSDNGSLVETLTAAAAQAGERVWRLPLSEEYTSDVVAEIADLNNAAGAPGAITAALYLREFAGDRRENWAHIDMSAPSWSTKDDDGLAKGATGWGVRTLVRWLAARAE
jgi:leucyl aminopeptidase